MTDPAEPQSYPETYYAGAYWGPRKESPEECARRTAHFLDLLAPCDPFLAHWYKPTRSLREERKHPLTPADVPALAELFRHGVNREKGGPVIEELGFSLWFGNGGGSKDRASLRIKCGDYSGANPNVCILALPSSGANADRVLSALTLTAIARAMALAWEPDWAVATSDSHRRLMSETSSAGAFLGWVTYLPHQPGAVPLLPAPVRVEPVEDRGTLVILTPERLTASNPEHVAQGRQVGELLAQAGLLRPVTS